MRKDIKGINEGFSSIDEFIDNISRGGEIEFEYENKKYSIVHSPIGIHVAEAYNEDSEKTYIQPSDVIEYRIKGKSLGSIITEIKIDFRCF